MLVKMLSTLEIIHIYGSKIKSNLTDQLREQRLPFTIIADECTDSYSNQEVLSVCLRFVDLSSFKDPHIKECFIGFIHLDRTNASTISKKILECITELPLSLDSSLIRGQAYDGAAVMSSEKAGVQAKIKEVLESTCCLPTLLRTLPESFYCISLQCSRSSKSYRINE